MLNVFHKEETLDILGVPADQGWHMAGCVSLGYPLGPWKVAARRPVSDVAYRNRWDGPLGLSIPDPLWSPS